MTKSASYVLRGSLLLCWVLACKDSGEGGAGPMSGAGSGAGSGVPSAGSGAAGTPATSAGSSAPSAGASGSSSPALSGTDVVGELGTARAGELCMELEEVITARVTDEEVERLMCVLFGVLFSAVPDGSGGGTIDVAACQQHEQECLAAPGELSSSMSCDTMAAAAELESCPLTLAELRACFEVYADGLAALLGVFRCDASASTAMASAALADIDPTAAPACMAVATQCPGLLPADASADPGGVGGEPSASGCDETCPFSGDGECDDGGPGSGGPFCPLGSDCMDCGPR